MAHIASARSSGSTSALDDLDRAAGDRRDGAGGLAAGAGLHPRRIAKHVDLPPAVLSARGGRANRNGGAGTTGAR